MKKQLLTLLLTTFSISFVGRATTFPPHLIQVLEVVNNIDNGLKETNSQIFAAENQRRSQRGTLLPQINAKTYTNLEMNNRLADDANATNISLTFEQTLFSPNEFAAYGQSKSKVELAKSVHEENKANLYFRAINAYLNFLKFHHLMENAIQNVKNFESHFEASKKRNRAGAITRTDVIKSEERLINAKTELFDLEFQLKAAKDEIRQLTNMEAQPNWHVPDIKNFMEKISANLKDQFAVKSNTAIRQLELETKVAEKQYQVQKNKHYPKISLYSLYDKDYSHEHDIVHTYTASVGLKLTIPLFTGGNIHYGKKNAFETFKANEYRLKNSVLKTQRELQTAIDNLNTREKIQKFNEQSKTLSEKSLKGIQREFLNGSKTSLNVLESKEDLNRIMKKTINAKFDIILQKFTILKYIGLLDINHVKRFLD
jgi:outer membrane protein